MGCIETGHFVGKLPSLEVIMYYMGKQTLGNVLYTRDVIFILYSKGPLSEIIEEGTLFGKSQSYGILASHYFYCSSNSVCGLFKVTQEGCGVQSLMEEL